LLAIPFGKGSCGGCHVPQTIAVILRVDEQHHILTSSVRTKALSYFAEISKVLDNHQLAEGGWDESWPGTDIIKRIYGDPVLDRMTVIGHHLEWIAMVPESIRPSHTTIANAVIALIRQIDELPPIRIRNFKTILPCSHAARALCLIRGQAPFVTWKEYWDSGRLTRSPGPGFELRSPVSTRRSQDTVVINKGQ
jgi:hypothetical protein